MKETTANIQTRPIAEEIEKPGTPELPGIQWAATGDSNTWYEIGNPRKGRIIHHVVRMLGQDGRTIVWDQPIYMENPGVVMAPVRRISAGKGQKEDKIIVYLIVVQRPIVQPFINGVLPSDIAAAVTDQGKRIIQPGITSLEFPRGIGNKTPTNFFLLGSYKMERITILGEQNALDAAGGLEEFAEEVPELKILPGVAPILASGINCNTSLFGTTVGGYVIPVCPDIREAEEKVATSATQQVEQIKGIIPLVYPFETDEVLAMTERTIRTGAWAANTPVLIDGFTLTMFEQISRLIRQNRIPITR